MKYLLLCGVHGDEQTAVLSTIKAYNAIKAEKHDSIELNLSLVNKQGLRACQRTVPEEDEPTTDMNRMYGGPTKYDTKVIIDSIKTIISAVDVVIDVHNSPSCANGILISNNAYAPDYVKFAQDQHIGYMLRESAVNTAKKYAIEKGKIGITVEMGGMGAGPELLKVIDNQTTFLHRLIMSLEVYTQNGGKFGKSACLPATSNMVSVHAHEEGIVSYHVDFGMPVNKGYNIADIIYMDHTVEQIYAPCDGWIADTNPALYVSPGDLIFDYQPEIDKL